MGEIGNWRAICRNPHAGSSGFGGPIIIGVDWLQEVRAKINFEQFLLKFHCDEGMKCIYFSTSPDSRSLKNVSTTITETSSKTGYIESAAQLTGGRVK